MFHIIVDHDCGVITSDYDSMSECDCGITMGDYDCGVTMSEYDFGVTMSDYDCGVTMSDYGSVVTSSNFDRAVTTRPDTKTFLLKELVKGVRRMEWQMTSLPIVVT